MIELDFCFSFEHGIANSILADPFSIVFSEGETQVDNVGWIKNKITVFNYFPVLIFQAQIHFDVSFLVNDFREISFESQLIFVFLLAE